METGLLVITGASLALAAGMGVVLARMVRDERRRSDARVALLNQLATEPAGSPSFADFDLREPAESFEQPTAVHDLFHEVEEPSPWPRRFAVIGGLAAAVFAVALGLSALNSTASESPAGTTEVQTQTVAPLELLSLRHTQEGGILTVTGLVQNPRSGAVLANAKATLFVFGPGGSFITSGRAPLDFTSLAAGEESPFVIRVPVSADVARYRIGFRGGDDRVLSHVDRRSADAIAQK